MIEQIIGATVVPTLQELIWTDQIGWMAKAYTRRVETGEGQWKDTIQPAANNVTVDSCGETADGLKVLLTDAGYDSLVLIKAESDMSSGIAPNIAQRKGLNIDQDFSINVWLNDHQGYYPLAVADIARLLYRATYKQINVGDGLYVNKIRITFLRKIESNPFSEYSFASDQAMVNGKYHAFGMVFKMSGLVFPNCFPSYPELDHQCGTPFTVAATANVEQICNGGEVILEGSIDGVESANYQWQKLDGETWVNIAGATEINYTTSSLTGAEGTEHTFRLKATKTGRTHYSNVLTITMQDEPEVFISASEPEIPAVIGASLLTSEVVGGIGGNTYQWQVKIGGVWTDINLETDVEYSVKASEWGIGVHTFRLSVTQEAGCDGVSEEVVIEVV